MEKCRRKRKRIVILRLFRWFVIIRKRILKIRKKKTLRNVKKLNIKR